VYKIATDVELLLGRERDAMRKRSNKTVWVVKYVLAENN
jgi:hypothetical protein